jgi:hypothetical protein
MSPKAKSAGKKATETQKRRAAGKKAAAKRKHRAAGKKGAKTRVQRAVATRTAETRAKKKPVQSAPAPAAPAVPSAIDKTEEPPLPIAMPETSVTIAESSEPSADPTASLKAEIEALRNARWGRR